MFMELIQCISIILPRCTFEPTWLNFLGTLKMMLKHYEGIVSLLIYLLTQKNALQELKKDSITYHN